MNECQEAVRLWMIPRYTPYVNQVQGAPGPYLDVEIYDNCHSNNYTVETFCISISKIGACSRMLHAVDLATDIGFQICANATKQPTSWTVLNSLDYKCV
jgi:hypothetical protein